jgi:hypothetical protein
MRRVFSIEAICLLDCSELGGQALQRLACEVGQTGVGIILDPFDELPGARQALCRDDAEFTTMPAQRIDQHRTLPNQKLARSMQHQH